MTDQEDMIERLRAVVAATLRDNSVGHTLQEIEYQTKVAVRPKLPMGKAALRKLDVALRALRPGDLGPQCEWTKEA